MIAPKIQAQLLEKRLNDLSRGYSLCYWNNAQAIPLYPLRWWISLMTLPVKALLGHNSVITGKRHTFQCDSPPVRFARHFASTSTPHSSTHATHSRNVDATHQPVGSFISPQPGTLHRDVSSSLLVLWSLRKLAHLALI